MDVRPIAVTDGMLCHVCLARLIPLSRRHPTNDQTGDDTRATLKCPGCGQMYRWHNGPA